MASINTNYGAMIAAQSFAATGRELDKVQNRITTGLKIANAKDNGAVWAVALTQRANSKALDATMNNLSRQQAIADVGLAAGDTIMAALTEMKALAAAIEAGNGKDAATAQRIREAATEEARRLKAQREQFAAEVEREQVSQPAQPSGPDPRVVSHATNWIEANPWYDPNLGNDESKIAKQLDEQLVREGYNPASREHWAELTNRLNHVFSAAAEGDDAPADGAKNRVRKGPPTSSTRETGVVNSSRMKSILHRSENRL